MPTVFLIGNIFLARPYKQYTWFGFVKMSMEGKELAKSANLFIVIIDQHYVYNQR